MKPSLVALCILFFLSSFSLSAQIRLPQIIGDGMVLQREQNVRIWGWASAGEEIALNFRGYQFHTTADGQGNWILILPPQAAGGPYDLIISGNNEIIVRNVLFGDVWLCAGQSNMVLPMERVKERYPEEIANAHCPEIRNYFIPTATNLREAQKDLPAGSWKSANPQDVLTFGAVAYFFALEIYEKYHVPIGLINASVGGTPIEAWISEAGLRDFPDLLDIVRQNKDTAYVNQTVRKSRANFAVRKETDKGLLEPVKWYDPAYVPKGWKNINIPGYWEDQGLKDLNGVVWYRKEIDVPDSMTDIPAKLFMGRIVDADHLYVNGELVGNITYQYPPRRYNLEAGILKPGKNTIVIRVMNMNGKGGFVPDKPYYLTANGQDIDLKGDWEYKVGDVFKPVANREAGFSFQNQPASLFNAMVAPLRNQAIKGILWYQGETNAGNPGPYYDLLPALINDWRQQWDNERLPFLYVQLANFMDRDFLPVESSWAELRDAQLNALSVPNTAMAVAIDLGEWNDIHPLNKKEVGHRLALGARHLSYGEEELVYSGPIYRSHTISGDKVIIQFDHTGSGLVSIDDEPLSQFAVAGANKQFEWADARIVNGAVEVSSKLIPNPVYVRYAWSNNPDGANLYNKEGLPASPFQITPEE
jgi:sialate O-acetylesterase